MNFIENIENEKKEYINKKNIKNESQYYFYKDIIFNGHKVENKFRALKLNYFKIIIENKEGIKLYLSDFDIICLLIDLYDYNAGNFILNSLYDFLKGKKEILKFEIDDEVYTIEGIEIPTIDIKIMTKANFCISVKELIILINLLLLKESYSNRDEPIKGVISKYISFVEVYKLNDDKSKDILVKSGYDISKSLKENEKYIARSGKSKLIVEFKDFNCVKKVI